MPGGIYGSRSIIPNNYYFTFDYIYDNEGEIAERGNSDSVLIGRCVLAKTEHTVWLKTTSGYIKVAKLDNESRFKFEEGYELDEVSCIDDILSQGNTPHGNGTYIVDFNKVSKIKTIAKNTSNITIENGATDIWDGEQLKKEPTIGTWPIISGLTQKKYLKNSVFSLVQYTQTLSSNESYEELFPDSAFSDEQKSPNNTEKAQKIYTNRNFVFYKEKEDENEYIKSPTDYATILSLLDNNKKFYVLKSKNYKIFQILTDLTNPDDENVTRTDDFKRYDHSYKMFIRTGTCTYGTETNIKDNSVMKQKYSFDASMKEFAENKNANSAYYRQIVWNDWHDLSEQYIGYIGNLQYYTDGNGQSQIDVNFEQAKKPFNKNNTYFKIEGNNYKKVNVLEEDFKASLNNKGISETYYIHSSSSNQNISDAESLVDAISKIDKILGSKNRFTKTGQSDESRNVNYVENGSLSTKLNQDKRLYMLPEENVMDSLVHHSADIGDLSKLSKENTYNLDFNTEKTEGAQLNDNTARSGIHSLTTAVQKLDNVLGAQRRFGAEEGVVNDSGSDGKFKVSGNENDNRPYIIKEKNVVDALVDKAADIGDLEQLNKKNTYNLYYHELEQEDLAQTTNRDPDDLLESDTKIQGIHSLTSAIKKLDNILGSQQRLGLDENSQVNEPPSYGIDKDKHTDKNNKIVYSYIDKNKNGEDEIDKARIISNDENDIRPYYIKEENIIDALVKLAADIGQLENFDNKNSNNLTHTKTEDEYLNATTNSITPAKVHSLVSAIYKLDSLLGKGERLKNNGDIQKKVSDNDSRIYYLPEENIIDALVRLSADIGSREKDNPDYNISDYGSLTEAVRMLSDRYIGDYLNNLANQPNGVVQSKSLSENLGILNTLIGEVSSLEGNNANSQQTLIDKLQAINNRIGEISELMGNGAEDKTSLIEKLQTINNNIGEVKNLTYADGSSIGSTNFINNLQTLIDAIGVEPHKDSLQKQLNDYIKLINNLAENVDYLEILVSQIGSEVTPTNENAPLMWATL